MAGRHEAEQERQHGRWDPLIRELHRLREAAGSPSYDTLARRLVAQRVAAGQDEFAARIAKSSVHDAFRLGRSRINERLVRELVQVLGGDVAAVEDWLAACVPAPAAESDPAPATVPDPPSAEPPPSAPSSHAWLLALACLALNLLGREFVDFFRLPVYLDMIGTAVAAIALGPWRGAAVGVATNVVGVIGSGWISLPFALVNVVGALLWGYGVRRWGMGRTLPRFFALNVATALACSAVAVPIIMAFLDHELRVGHDVITQLIGESIATFEVALGFANVLTSLADKLVSGFVALVVVSALPGALRRGAELVGTDAPSRSGG